MLLLLIEGRRDRQDNRDRTSGPMPAAMGRGRTATFRAASAGLDGNQASPLMLFQQSAELSVLRPQGSLCIAHTVMIADRHDARHASGLSGLTEGEHQLAPYKISAAQAHRPLTWTRSEGLEPSSLLMWTAVSLAAAFIFLAAPWPFPRTDRDCDA